MKNLLRIWARSVSQTLGRSPDTTPYITALDEYSTAKTVFCYVSVNSEPDTTAFLAQALADGKRLCVPLCKGHGVMEAIEVHDLTLLKENKFGIPEPVNGKAVPISQIDFAVIPCLCADAYSNRLGHGGGYYDRFLSDYNGFSLLLCRKELAVDSIPLERHDMPTSKVLFI